MSINVEDRPLGTEIWCPYEPDMIDDQGRVVRRQPDCSECTYRTGCTETMPEEEAEDQ